MEMPDIREVVLLHIACKSTPAGAGRSPDTEIEHATSCLAEYKDAIMNAGIAVRSELDIIDHPASLGAIGSRILDIAGREKVSMIIMGARGKTLHDLFLGSVSTYVLHNATVPLLLVRSPVPAGKGEPGHETSYKPVFSKVLVPTDFSVPAAGVTGFLKEIPGVHEIILLHVINAEKNDPGVEDRMREARVKVRATSDELAGEGFHVQGYVRCGYPPGEIILLAGQEDATLIAMSPLGEGWLRGLKELVVGSTTYAVARRADRPVLVVRPVRKE